MYGKFFSSTFTGSMYGAGASSFAVWGYVIANTVDGHVELNPKFLAPIIGTEEDEVRRAIDYLCSPDANSRNPEHEGRRLLPIGPFMYSVPSHRHYHGMRDENERRTYMRDYMRRKRKKDVNTSVNFVSPSRSRKQKQIQKQKQKTVLSRNLNSP
jgi:hypothetical protein